MEALGGDLGELLDRIARGHSEEWDGNNTVGTLTADAQEAEEELVDRINEAEFELPNTWLAGEWLDGDPHDDETAEILLEIAESDGIRIWKGKEALQEALNAARADNNSEHLSTKPRTLPRTRSRGTRP